MAVLYHLMIPRPEEPGLDAVVQEVEQLRAQAGGEVVYLNPARRPGSPIPERLYGLQRLFELRRREAQVDLHHVYHSHPLYFPYLRWLRRPIVYSVTAGLHREKEYDLGSLGKLAAIVVSNERDRGTLAAQGLHNVHLIRPGIDPARFPPRPPPGGPGLTVLAGSAPWTRQQFRDKGVEALLAAASARPDLHLVFLWRGLLFEEMQQLVRSYGLQERVTVIDRRVDVAEVLSGAHAAVVLATDATLVKAFPHSLLEALATGRPVLVSRALPMAGYVERSGCGQVVEQVAAEAILAALEKLEAGYEAQRRVALQVGRRDFSQAAFIEAVRALYGRLTG